MKGYVRLSPVAGYAVGSKSSSSAPGERIHRTLGPKSAWAASIVRNIAMAPRKRSDPQAPGQSKRTPGVGPAHREPVEPAAVGMDAKDGAGVTSQPQGRHIQARLVASSSTTTNRSSTPASSEGSLGQSLHLDPACRPSCSAWPRRHPASVPACSRACHMPSTLAKALPKGSSKQAGAA